MNLEFWNKKRVLITGHSGFKGSWLSVWLQKLGAEVWGYALAPKAQPNMFDALQIAQSMNSVFADIRDLKTLRDFVDKASPEIIIHMAAQPLVRYSYENPVETFDVNVMGTVNILEAARQTRSVKTVLNITTDKCYENREWVWPYRENDPLGGHDPYSSSKACSELVTASFRNSFAQGNDSELKIATARAGNVIGGGDWSPDRLIPDFFRAIDGNTALNIRFPNAIRPWQHVLEPLCGYLSLIEARYTNSQEFEGAWNFGPSEDDARSVGWIADYLTKHWPGTIPKWTQDGGVHHHEAQYLKLDTSKVRSKIAWAPKMNLEKSLDLVVEWQQAFLRKDDMRAITHKQIDAYMTLQTKDN